MKNTNRILHHPRFRAQLEALGEWEKDRVFCRHDLAHFLDVARIATILCMEEGLGLSRDLIYTTALLHDLGRVEQYRSGKDHALASAEEADFYLNLTDFSSSDKALIREAILGHRRPDGTGFKGLFYRADKFSRACFSCPAAAECRWSEEKKNRDLIY